jgi:hypothetical protein
MRIRTALLAGLLSGFFVGPAFAVTFQSGDVFASVNNGEVQVYRAGALIQTLNTGQGGFTTGSTTDAAGNFYVTNFSAGSVSKFDPSGVGLGIAASGYNLPESIVFAQNGTTYVSQVGGTSIGTFTNPNAVPVGARTDWIDLAANQTTILYTNEGNTIFKTTTAGAALTPFATSLPGTNAFALRILADGSVLVADSQFALHLDALGNILKTYTVANVQSLFALNINPDGTSFWTGDDGTGILYEFDIATGNLLSTLDTGVGGGNLFGVSVYGEFQAGGGGVGGSDTPLPAALPLFATGLGALGLLARRRKRKRVSIAH